MKFNVTVKPGAKLTKVEMVGPRELNVWVHAPPHEGRANEAVIDALADYWGVAKSTLQIVAGHQGKRKVVEKL